MHLNEVDQGKLSPMMREYLKTKTEVGNDCILLYRLGDFFEIFFEDAELCSKELELTLTGKQCGLDERAPMCGVPFHAVDGYVNKLVKRGYKVAICDQVEDPKLAKGLVKREITQFITPGTNTSTSLLEDNGNNYIISICHLGDKIGISVADVTTGDFLLSEVSDNKSLMDELYKFNPSEIICNEAFMVCGIDLEEIRNRIGCIITSLLPHYFDDDRCKKALTSHFKVNSISGLGIEDFLCGTTAAGAMLLYLTEMQKSDLSHFTHIIPYLNDRYMLIDSSTRRNLELTETMRDKQRRGSLLWVLDKTKTAMGSRMLGNYLKSPLLDIGEINMRLDSVEMLCKNPVERDEIREYLNAVYDLERLIGKVSYKTIKPIDMIALKNSLAVLPYVKMLASELDCELLKTIGGQIDGLEDICGLIDVAILDEPSMNLKEGNIIKDGYSEDVDKLKVAKKEGKVWLADLEASEKERTGINNLHIKYNHVFGYFIEITNSNLDKTPDDYIRKQTLTNAERFSTAKLKELEDIILNSEERLVNLEYELFCDIRDHIAANIDRIQATAKAVATLDALCSLSLVAERNNYVRPKLNSKGIIKITEGRHPVVERMIPGDLFIPNDTLLDNGKNLIAIITGPNMAGKSTYMRQTALIVLMAQIGSFVPAQAADIGVCDRIFTRVGASDDLASGQSTFMVEMNEVSNILRNATSNSLLILDEIGRGTSTFDGLSIAWAVIEHIANTKILGAKTLFATHYHELTELEGRIGNVKNFSIAVKEQGDNIVFLRKIVKGGADKSYGIQVAKLAGVPDMVIDRAKEILNQLVDNDILEKIQSIEVKGGSGTRSKPVEHLDEVDLAQMSLFDTVSDEDVLNELKSLDISSMTPLDALNTLYKLQNRLNNRFSFD
ncbi:MAG: DNA mismatch repair protein MutS [Lachnospiraceae bacterium]|nr:DNA mismatch repair protein MutS [Lachnospiraceae bacterium]